MDLTAGTDPGAAGGPDGTASSATDEAPPTVPAGLRLGVPGQSRARTAPSVAPRRPDLSVTRTRPAETPDAQAPDAVPAPTAPGPTVPAMPALVVPVQFVPPYDPAPLAPSTRAAANRAARGTARPLPEDGTRARWRWRRLVVAAVACTVVGATTGAGLASVDSAAGRRDRQAAPLLARAAAAAAELETTSYPLDPERLGGLLRSLEQLDDRVAPVTTGGAWTIARLTTRRDRLGDTADRVRGLRLMAEAAGPLRDTLAGIRTGEASAPERLDALARDLNRFASSSDRARSLGLGTAGAGPTGTSATTKDPAVQTFSTFDRLATAAAVLPGLAGTEAPRSWIACRSATAGCTTFTLRGGRASGIRRVPVSARAAVGTDVVVVGVEAVELLGSDGDPVGLVDGQELSVPAALDMLVATEQTGDDATVVVTSAVAVEQHALDLLTRRG